MKVSWQLIRFIGWNTHHPLSYIVMHKRWRSQCRVTQDQGNSWHLVLPHWGLCWPVPPHETWVGMGPDKDEKGDLGPRGFPAPYASTLGPKLTHASTWSMDQHWSLHGGMGPRELSNPVLPCWDRCNLSSLIETSPGDPRAGLCKLGTPMIPTYREHP